MTPHPLSLAWMTDLHLDQSPKFRTEALYREIKASPANSFVVTGDISNAKLLPLHLCELADAAGRKMIYFTLGNHDFYGSSFAETDNIVAGVCSSHQNLRHLDGNQMIPLDADTALIGHRGWSDGRAGWGKRSLAKNPDFRAISDFVNLNNEERFRLIFRLGLESAGHLRSLLPYALTCYQRVIVATHFPPVTQATHYNGTICDWLRQPFFCNLAVGGMILCIAKNFPRQDIIVLCGHTHSAVTVAISDNVTVHCGAARPGHPSVGKHISFAPWNQLAKMKQTF